LAKATGSARSWNGVPVTAWAAAARLASMVPLIRRSTVPPGAMSEVCAELLMKIVPSRCGRRSL
jgi:hypothetical protein